MNKEDYINGRLLIALGRSYQAAHRDSLTFFREHGVTYRQFAVLEALYSKGPLTIQQIIDSVLSSSGNMTVVVRNLERRHWVVKNRNLDDKRSFIITLTEGGKNLTDVLLTQHMKNLSNFFCKLSQEEKQHIATLLKKTRRV
jgi:DNA-binding MarR family transcriptional regulator